MTESPPKWYSDRQGFRDSVQESLKSIMEDISGDSTRRGKREEKKGDGEKGKEKETQSGSRIGDAVDTFVDPNERESTDGGGDLLIGSSPGGSQQSGHSQRDAQYVIGKEYYGGVINDPANTAEFAPREASEVGTKRKRNRSPDSPSKRLERFRQRFKEQRDHIT
jgi:hypothetical protein